LEVIRYLASYAFWGPEKRVNHHQERAITASSHAALALAAANSAIRHASKRLERGTGHVPPFTRCGKSSHFEIGSDKRISQHLSGPGRPSPICKAEFPIIRLIGSLQLAAAQIINT
jgi:hypothetical protein